jgi:tetratricopeptide (TPR) repeat protein
MKSLVTALLVAFAAVLVGAQGLASDQDRREALKEYRLGQELLTSEQWEKAAAAFERAIKRDSLFTDAHFGRGQAYMGLRRYVTAIQAFEATIEAARTLHGLRDKNRVEVDRQIDDEIRELRDQLRRTQTLKGSVAVRSTALDERLRDLERQKSSLGSAFEPPAAVLLSLGSAHFRNGDRTSAEELWAQAVRINSRLGEAWNNLAAIYLSSGRKKQAEEAVRNAERAGFRVNPRMKDDIRQMK